MFIKKTITHCRGGTETVAIFPTTEQVHRDSEKTEMESSYHVHSHRPKTNLVVENRFEALMLLTLACTGRFDLFFVRSSTVSKYSQELHCQ